LKPGIIDSDGHWFFQSESQSLPISMVSLKSGAFALRAAISSGSEDCVTRSRPILTYPLLERGSSQASLFYRTKGTKYSAVPTENKFEGHTFRSSGNLKKPALYCDSEHTLNWSIEYPHTLPKVCFTSASHVLIQRFHGTRSTSQYSHASIP